ncbi:MAG: hypothetical protein NVS2B6_03060 [Thermoleophilaceae bacterium]
MSSVAAKIAAKVAKKSAVRPNQGAVVVDERLRTTVRGMDPIGDSPSARPFTPRFAADQMHLGGQNAPFVRRHNATHDAVSWATVAVWDLGRAGSRLPDRITHASSHRAVLGGSG